MLKESKWIITKVIGIVNKCKPNGKIYFLAQPLKKIYSWSRHSVQQRLNEKAGRVLLINSCIFSSIAMRIACVCVPSF